MILIIIGFTLFICGIFVFRERLENKFGFVAGTLIQVIIAVIGGIVMCMGLLVPLHGYEEPVVFEEYTLCEVIEGTGIYVIENNDGTTVTCKYVSAGNDEKVEKETYFIYDKYYKRYTIIPCEVDKPILQKKVRKAKKSFISFALAGNTTEYVFYVPENGIAK